MPNLCNQHRSTPAPAQSIPTPTHKSGKIPSTRRDLALTDTLFLSVFLNREDVLHSADDLDTNITLSESGQLAFPWWVTHPPPALPDSPYSQVDPIKPEAVSSSARGLQTAAPGVVRDRHVPARMGWPQGVRGSPWE